jgi:hypothetical protein
MKSLVVLTQYKRQHLEKQLQAISEQTHKPDYLVVFQNESHVDITSLKEKYSFIHIHSDYNTKYFGRFSICFNFPVDLCIIMDDDIIPGKNCLKNYFTECVRHNGIIGGNGRMGYNSTNPYQAPNKMGPFPEFGYRPETRLVDFVGHVWCFKKDWLYYMFSVKPLTYDTGEDMHLCYSCKVKGNIKAYICKQVEAEDNCDTAFGGLSCDKFSSYLTTKQNLRKAVEDNFIHNHGLQIITEV